MRKINNNNKKHIIITLLKLLGVSILLGIIIWLAIRYNFTEKLGNYGLIAVSFLAYCGAFSYIGIDDALYYYRKYLIKKYSLNKEVNVRVTYYDLKEKGIEIEWQKYNICDYNFNFKNQIYFKFKNQTLINKYFYAFINPITNGLTLVSETGVEYTKKYITIDDKSFNNDVKENFIKTNNNQQYINLNNLKLKMM